MMTLILILVTMIMIMVVLQGLAVRGACSAVCSRVHAGEQCLVCGKMYSEHDGHSCPSLAGKRMRGVFMTEEGPSALDAKRLLFAMGGVKITELGHGEELEDRGSSAIATNDSSAPAHVKERDGDSSPGVLQGANVVGATDDAAAADGADGDSDVRACVDWLVDSVAGQEGTTQQQPSPETAFVGGKNTGERQKDEKTGDETTSQSRNSDADGEGSTEGEGSKTGVIDRRMQRAEAAAKILAKASSSTVPPGGGIIYGVAQSQFVNFLHVKVPGDESGDGGARVREEARLAAEGRLVIGNTVRENVFQKMSAVRDAMMHKKRHKTGLLDGFVLEHVTRSLRLCHGQGVDVRSRFLPHTIASPYSCDVELSIRIAGGSLIVVTDAGEYEQCLGHFGVSQEARLVPRRVAAASEGGDEWRVTLAKGSSLNLFFRQLNMPLYAPLLPPLPNPGELVEVPEIDEGEGDRRGGSEVAEVGLYSGGKLLEALRVDMTPLPPAPNRTLCLYIPSKGHHLTQQMTGEGTGGISGILPLYGPKWACVASATASSSSPLPQSSLLSGNGKTTSLTAKIVSPSVFEQHSGLRLSPLGNGFVVSEGRCAPTDGASKGVLLEFGGAGMEAGGDVFLSFVDEIGVTREVWLLQLSPIVKVSIETFAVNKYKIISVASLLPRLPPNVIPRGHGGYTALLSPSNSFVPEGSAGTMIRVMRRAPHMQQPCYMRLLSMDTGATSDPVLLSVISDAVDAQGKSLSPTTNKSAVAGESSSLLRGVSSDEEVQDDDDVGQGDDDMLEALNVASDTARTRIGAPLMVSGEVLLSIELPRRRQGGGQSTGGVLSVMGTEDPEELLEDLVESTGYSVFSYVPDPTLPQAKMLIRSRDDMELMLLAYTAAKRRVSNSTGPRGGDEGSGGLRVQLEGHEQEEVEYITLQQQRRNRFAREGGEDSWLTSQKLRVATDTLTAVSQGTLGVYDQGVTGYREHEVFQDMLGDGLRRSIQGIDPGDRRGRHGLVPTVNAAEMGVKFEMDSVKSHNGSEVLAGKILTDEPRHGWRTLKGRTVKLTFLLQGQGGVGSPGSDTTPLCDLLVPVLPDGSSALSWQEFWSRFRSVTGGRFSSNRFAYSPKPGRMLPSGSVDHTPWCLKGYPHINIRRVEDEIAEGVCALTVPQRVEMLQRARRVWKEESLSSIIAEVALLFDSASNYQMGAGLSTGVGASSSSGGKKESKRESEMGHLAILTNALKRALAPAWSRARDGGGSVENFVSVLDIYDMGEGATKKAWAVVKVVVDDVHHGQVLTGMLVSDKELGSVEDCVTLELRKAEEDRAKAEKGRYTKVPITARFHRRIVGGVPYAFYRFPSQIKDDTLRLQEMGTDSSSKGSQASGWLSWRGVCIRYEGDVPFPNRHDVAPVAEGDSMSRVYTYIDVQGNTIYRSDGTVIVDSQADLSQALRGEVCSSRNHSAPHPPPSHPPAYPRPQSQPLTLALTTSSDLHLRL